MKARMKLFLNSALTFAVIFFVVYLLMVLAAFLGCCTGVTDFFYERLIWIIVALGILVFALCFYNSCYKKSDN